MLEDVLFLDFDGVLNPFSGQVSPAVKGKLQTEPAKLIAVVTDADLFPPEKIKLLPQPRTCRVHQ